MLTTKAIVTSMMIPKVVSLTGFTQSWLFGVSELLTFATISLKSAGASNKICRHIQDVAERDDALKKRPLETKSPARVAERPEANSFGSARLVL